MKSPGFYEKVVPILPAFMAYERGLVDWFSGMWIAREGGTIKPLVKYAGGEKSVLAAQAEVQNRNQRVKAPVITLRLADIQPNLERYIPPENTWGIIWNGPTKATSTRAARISKPAGYKCSYEVQFSANFEIDLRYLMFAFLQRFQRHGGNLSYLTLTRPGGSKDFFPLWLRNFNNATTSEGADSDRQVKAIAQIELEAYLPLNHAYVPVFRRLIEEVRIQGETEVAATIEVGPGGP